MKRLIAAVLLLSFTALAGDKLVGVISVINSTKSNASSNPDGGPNSWDGGIYQPFPITAGALLTIQCNDSMYIATDSATATSLTGLNVNSGAIFLTSVGGTNSTSITAVGPDTKATAQVAILPVVTDGGTKSCVVFERRGNE